MVDKEEKVTVGWRRCVHDIYLSNPTGKRRTDGHLLDAWYRDFVCIVRVGWVGGFVCDSFDCETRSFFFSEWTGIERNEGRP